MIVYVKNTSKKRKVPKKQVDQYNLFLKKLSEISKTSVKSGVKPQKSLPKLTAPPGRETPNYPSLNSTEYTCTKKQTMYYTGDKMKGIGTLHKSNAVPVFTDEEAQDQARMRR